MRLEISQRLGGRACAIRGIYALTAIVGLAVLLALHYAAERKAAEAELVRAAETTSAIAGEAQLDAIAKRAASDEALPQIRNVENADLQRVFFAFERDGKLEVLSGEKADAPFVKAALASGKPVFASRAQLGSSDKASKLVLACVPMKTKSGKSYAVCVEERMDPLLDRHSSFPWEAAILAAVALLLPAALLLFGDAGGETSSPAEADAKPLEKLIDEKQAQLVHAGRLVAMGEITPGVAHEINQPLCIIRGYLELLHSALADDPSLKEKQLEGAFEIGIKSVDKASRIINHMRSFVRVKAVEPRNVSLKTCIEEGLCFFNEQIKLHNIALEMNFEENLPEIVIDPQKFEQLVVNLVSNARFAVDEKGEKAGRDFKKRIELRLRAVEDGKRVVFEVRDNGIGMSPETVKRCREPFFTTKKPGEGTGLGVCIASRIAANAKGELSISSVEGEGSVFSVSFPAAAPQSPKPSA